MRNPTGTVVAHLTCVLNDFGSRYEPWCPGKMRSPRSLPVDHSRVMAKAWLESGTRRPTPLFVDFTKAQFAQNLGAPAVIAEPHCEQNTMPPLFETNSLESSPLRRGEVSFPNYCQMPTGPSTVRGTLRPEALRRKSCDLDPPSSNESA